MAGIRARSTSSSSPAMADRLSVYSSRMVRSFCSNRWAFPPENSDRQAAETAAALSFSSSPHSSRTASMGRPVMEAGMAVWMAVRERRISRHRPSSRSCRRVRAGGGVSTSGWGSCSRRRGWYGWGSAGISKGMRFSFPTFLAKMVNAVVIVSPISLQASSISRLVSSSTRKLIITCAILITSLLSTLLYHL